MKRILLLFSAVVCTTLVLCALRNETVRAAQRTSKVRELQRVQAQRLDELRLEREQLRSKAREAKTFARAELSAASTGQLASEFAADALKHLSGDNAERLLAELGFDWNSMGAYVFVSKTSLPQIRVPAIRGSKLTRAGCAALALTPDEHASIDAELQRLTSEYDSWLRSHVQREEPSGNVLAKYVLSSDAQFSTLASNAFTGVLYATLGQERGTLLQQYSWNWMESMGMFGNSGGTDRPTSMTVTREAGNLLVQLQQAMSVMTCGISPNQPFPEAFRPLFPGGWKELSQREAFELPKEFSGK